MSGPPDKWTKFKVTNDANSDDVLARLNVLADEGFTTSAFALHTTDGLFVYVSGYTENDD